ncbi:hypothetical protein D1AOALGA4SA_8759 [Olavius algarvensis Delta 1 endosymbiont]|nr:hypothetical protein D1AOALGA4SA_8759 [Olavius algarvensis Delta 1 endosymbiont]
MMMDGRWKGFKLNISIFAFPFHLNFFRCLSSVIGFLTSDLCHLSSDLCHLSSIA